MPHATEGELHAHIDGALDAIDPTAAARLVAHLETCADCRGRLAEARSVRDESAALLEVALGGAVEPPPFEMLARKAGRRGDLSGGVRRPQRRPGGEKLAWAASIAVALGAGWMGHAVLRAPGYLGFASLDSGPVALGVAGAPPRAVDALESFDDALGRVGGETEGVTAENEPRALQLADALPADRANATGIPADPDAEPGETTNRRLAQERSETGDAEGADLEVASKALVAVAGVQVVEVTESSQPDARERVAQRSELPAPTPVEADALGRESTVGRAADAASERNVATFADEAFEELEWLLVEREAAEAESAGSIPRIPDLEILDYAIALPRGSGRTRVRQRLPGGEILEVMTLGPGSAAEDEQRAPVAVRAPPAARRDLAGADRPDAGTDDASPRFVHLWIELNGMRVRASAPIAPDSLRALALRIR